MKPILRLASGSPRRKAILEAMGIPTIVCPTKVSEHLNLRYGIDLAMQSLAYQKMRAAIQLYPGSLILTADTLVHLDGQALGKPQNEQQAIHMLTQLSNKTHQVSTGLCFYDGRIHFHVEHTQVTFRSLSQEEIIHYVKTRKPYDKAGAYGIQESDFVSHLEGLYSNVVGLPSEILPGIIGTYFC